VSDLTNLCHLLLPVVDESDALFQAAEVLQALLTLPLLETTMKYLS